jgi:hypothetical protein
MFRDYDPYISPGPREPVAFSCAGRANLNAVTGVQQVTPSGRMRGARYGHHHGARRPMRHRRGDRVTIGLPMLAVIGGILFLVARKG